MLRPVRAARLAIARRLRRLSDGDLLHAEGALGWVCEACRLLAIIAAIACAIAAGRLESAVGWW